jgi:hypothetical protein
MSDKNSILSSGALSSLKNAPLALSDAWKSYWPILVSWMLAKLHRAGSSPSSPLVSVTILPLSTLIASAEKLIPHFSTAQKEHIMSDLSRLFAALRDSIVSGAPHLQGYLAAGEAIATDVAAVVPGASQVVTAIHEAAAITSAAVSEGQSLLEQVGTTPPNRSMIPPTPIAQVIVEAPAPVPSPVPPVAPPTAPQVSVADSVPSLPVGVDAAASAAGSTASAAASPDAVIARIMALESALAPMLDVLQVFIKDRGL